MNTRQLQALATVLDYLWEDEAEDFWSRFPAGPRDPNHIYRDLLILKEYHYEQTQSEGEEEQREDWHNQGDGGYYNTEWWFNSYT